MPGWGWGHSAVERMLFVAYKESSGFNLQFKKSSCCTSQIPIIFCQLYIFKSKNLWCLIILNLNKTAPAFLYRQNQKSSWNYLYFWKGHMSEWPCLGIRAFSISCTLDGKRPIWSKRWKGEPAKFPVTSHQYRSSFSARSPGQNRHKYPKVMPQRQCYPSGLAKQGSYFLIPGSA